MVKRKKSKGGLDLKVEQWNSIDDQLEVMGRRQKPSKADVFFAPLKIVHIATMDLEISNGDNLWDSAFPLELKVYVNRFEAKDLVKNTAETFRCNQLSVRRDATLGNIRKVALQAYREAVEYQNNKRRVNGVELLPKHLSESGFLDRWQFCMSYCHVYLHYRIKYYQDPSFRGLSNDAIKEAAFKDAVEYYNEFANPEKDDTGKTAKTPEGKVVRGAMSTVDIKHQLLHEGIVEWWDWKMLSYSRKVSNHKGPFGLPILFPLEHERVVLDFFVAFLKSKTGYTNSANFIPKEGTIDTLTSIQDWLESEDTDEHYKVKFGWIGDIETSKTIADEQEALEAAFQAVEEKKKEVDRLKKEAERLQKEKEKKEREDQEKKEKEEREKEAEKQRLEDERLEEEQRKKEEKEATQKERDWLSSWNDPKKPSPQLTYRKQQYMDAEKWLQDVLKKNPFETVKVDCQDQSLKQKFDRMSSRGKGPLKHATTAKNNLVRTIAKSQAKYLTDDSNEQFRVWCEKWDTIYKEQREDEEDFRDFRGADGGIKSLVWDDPEKPTPKRSLYFEHTIVNDISLRDLDEYHEDTQHPEDLPSEKKVYLMRGTFSTVRDMIEVDFPDLEAYNDTKLADHGSSRGFITQEAFWAGVKLGYFAQNWSLTQSKESLAHWLSPVQRVTFHVYMESFLELSIQPHLKKRIFCSLNNVKEENLKDDWSKMVPDKRREVIVWKASKDLFDEYSDFLLKKPSTPANPDKKTWVLKEPSIKRHAARNLPEKSLDDIEKASLVWVNDQPKTFWNFRHQIKKGYPDFKFDVEEALKVKEFGGGGYFDPSGPKGLNETEQKRTEEIEAEAEAAKDLKRKALDDICGQLRKRQRVVAPLGDPSV